MVIMAVDLGTVRTGIAVSDKSETFAFPRDVIQERNRENLYKKIAERVALEKAEMLVLGLPKNMDGTEGFKAEESYKAKEVLEQLTSLKVELFDERCTTIIAHNSLRQSGKNAKNSKNIVDSVAATIILEGFLNLRKNS